MGKISNVPLVLGRRWLVKTEFCQVRPSLVGAKDKSSPLRANELLPREIDISQKDKLASDQVERQHLHAKQFEPLAVGQECWLQHHSSGEWYTKAVILVRRDSDSYYIKTSEGQEYTRGRRLLRPVVFSESVNRIQIIMLIAATGITRTFGNIKTWKTGPVFLLHLLSL